jgi:hypothetical protein
MSVLLSSVVLTKCVAFFIRFVSKRLAGGDSCVIYNTGFNQYCVVTNCVILRFCSKIQITMTDVILLQHLCYN